MAATSMIQEVDRKLHAYGALPIHLVQTLLRQEPQDVSFSHSAQQHTWWSDSQRDRQTT